MLDNRKKRVLQAIIEEYISTAEPVSSAIISKNYGLDCSSSTIRNYMAGLESFGYLDKPYTSSGRVPSSKAYRLYVNELLNEEVLSIDEINYIKSKFKIKINELKELNKIATNILSEITHYTSVSIGPKTYMHSIEEIKIILLTNKILMVVILTDAGIVKETIVKLEEDITLIQFELLNSIFSNFKGQLLKNMKESIKSIIYSRINYNLRIIIPIIEQINKVLEEDEEIYLEGVNNCLEFPEFNSLENARKFINIIDEKETITKVLNENVQKEINIYIGNEAGDNKLDDFSIVTFKHKKLNKDLGVIGIIGPKRMDYAKVISVVKLIQKQLNNKDFYI